MFLQDRYQERSEILIKLGSEGRVVREFRKLAIDSTNNLDIVVSDEFKILLLILFSG